MMKRLFFTFTILVFLNFATVAQSPKPTPKGAKMTNAKTTKLALKEKEELEKARNLTDLTEKIAALQKFTLNFPKSKEMIAVLEMLVTTRTQLADEKLRTGDSETAIKLYKEAVTEAPTPISEQIFADAIFGIPAKLYAVKQPEAAVEIAKQIEEKVSDNAKQLVGVATFYVGTENAAEAKRITEKAIALDANLPVAYQTLGLVNRLNFDLAASADSYEKALNLVPDSIVSRRNLAEMKRATGKSDEAVALYRELVERDANDIAAQTGLILSLFDANKQEEAETAMSKSLETVPNNVILLVGAAYWYASQNNGDKAIELANKAIEIEPRYVWSRIALARGLMLKNQAFEAEKVLLIASQYGSFPTLDYELATARLQAGFYEEAVRDLKRRFYVKDNYVQTYIAGRVAKEAETFTELLGLERQASIFIPKAADNAETSEQLKRLLDFNLKLNNKDTTEDELNKAVDEFTKGDDKMKMHRQLYVASRLIDAKRNLSKAFEVTQNAVKGVDDSLEVSYPSAAVLADELLESRILAISRGEVVNTPDVPRQTLSRILRGRIEELTGWNLYEQEKPQEAVVRLKRAVSILPEKSSYWRSSLWRLGRAQFAVGNYKEALAAYIQSYVDGPPDRFRRGTIEALYRKNNGTLDGLDKLIGPNPFEEVAQTTPTPTVEATPAPTPEIVPATTPEAKIESSPTPEVTPETKKEITPTPEVKTEPTPTPEVKVDTTPTPNESPKIEENTEIKITEKPTPTPEIKVETTPEITPIPTPTAETKVETAPEVKTETTPIPTPTVETKIEPTPTPETKIETTPTVSPTPKTIFEPIIINVPNSKDKTSETKETEKKETEKIDETEKKELEKTDEPEKKEPEQNKENEQVAQNITNSIDPITRPRVITEKKEDEPKEETPTCLVASQETLSILSNGGNLGILVGYEREGEIGKLKAESNSPADVTVSFEPGIGRQSNRAFFVIKSISDKKGIFIITFSSPCGKKEVQVKVR